MGQNTQTLKFFQGANWSCHTWSFGSDEFVWCLWASAFCFKSLHYGEPYSTINQLDFDEGCLCLVSRPRSTRLPQGTSPKRMHFPIAVCKTITLFSALMIMRQHSCLMDILNTIIWLQTKRVRFWPFSTQKTFISVLRKVQLAVEYKILDTFDYNLYIFLFQVAWWCKS